MNFDKYIHYVPFPDRKNFTTYHHYKGGKYLGQSNDSFPMVVGAVVDKVVDEEAYKAAQDTYYNAESNTKQMFFDDLCEEFCITNHRKKDRFLYLCWQEGHSGGFSEVYNVACTWIDLLEG